MIDFKKIIENESVEDVLLFFAPRTAYPAIDRMYVRYKFEVIENGLLYPAYEKLLKEGKFSEDEKGHTHKGPNWLPPKFVAEKKYGIE
ncbi:immunity protein [Serratia quinivorans]|uniref:immunity protein n=1 Tax=Serratia quinivorans TaxID=137545 RepID=UPI003F97BC2B